MCLNKWWRGLDSNQRTLSGQIYSLVDLTTLPPLHKDADAGRKACAHGGERGL